MGGHETANPKAACSVPNKNLFGECKLPLRHLRHVVLLMQRA